MIKNDEAISKVIEFTTAFTVFILILASFFNAIDTRFTPQERVDSKLLNKATTISNMLIEDTGFIRNISNGTTSWENYPAKSISINIKDNISRIGFASKKNGVLSYNKIRGIGNITYFQLKEIFGLDLYDFNITIYELGKKNKPLSIFGLDYRNADKLAIVTRIVNILFENGEYIIAKIETRVFLYGRSTERVIINEFMYNPKNRDYKDEWVEVYNPTYLAIDLTNWSIGNKVTKARIIGYEEMYGGKGAIIPSFGYAVIAPNTERVKNSYKGIETIWLGLENTDKFGSNGLSDLEGEIIIERFGAKIDLVSYNITWGGDGKSLQKIHTQGNNTIYNWKEGKETPGKENFK